MPELPDQSTDLSLINPIQSLPRRTSDSRPHRYKVLAICFRLRRRISPFQMDHLDVSNMTTSVISSKSIMQTASEPKWISSVRHLHLYCHRSSVKPNCYEHLRHPILSCLSRYFPLVQDRYLLQEWHLPLAPLLQRGTRADDGFRCPV